MDSLAVESVDLVVTSPPYDNLRTYNDGDAWTWRAFERAAEQLVRVLKPGGVIVWNVNDATVNGSETGSSFRQVLHFMESGLFLADTMIWEKSGSGALGSQRIYAQNFEYMFIMSKGKHVTFNAICDRKNVIGSGKVSTNGGLVDGKGKNRVVERKPFGKRNNIWRIDPQRLSWHPAPFPDSFAQDHIISWSNPGDLVLDPFGGSGTTAVAAENAERRWICIERDEDYAAKAVERIRQHVSGETPASKRSIPKSRAVPHDVGDHQASLFG